MATKRLRDSANYNENVRNSILDKRVTSLFKKAEELSIVLSKLVTHEDYLQKKVDKKEEQISKLEKLNEAKEMEILFNQLVEGKSIDELDAREMKGLLKLFAQKGTIATLGDGSSVESAQKEGNGVNVEDDGHFKDLD
ncbi:uncharacterized protein [Solanum lycopersicum]|uniref:uncharacterized protein n=1 Tax=Solanum lycopersicum TaxID=4081 RepID=UPI000E1C798B|nr:uncharacterized protein LOC112940470 [Solanum lycopersicum]